MTYADIFIIGWNLNALMFILNLFLAVNILKSNECALCFLYRSKQVVAKL